MNTNDEPVITSIPVTTAWEDTQYIYQIQVEEVDVGDVITYKLVSSPGGMTVNSNGLVQWMPGAADIGTTQVMLEASDGNGGKAAQFFTVVVAHSNHPPTVPGLLSPKDGDQIHDENMLAWSGSTDMDSGEVVTYRLEICSDNNFITPEVTAGGLTGTGVFIKDLPGADQLQKLSVYYWRVRAEDDQGGVSAYSPNRYFAYLGANSIADRYNGPAAGQALALHIINGQETVYSFMVPAGLYNSAAVLDITGRLLARMEITAGDKSRIIQTEDKRMAAGIYMLYLKGPESSGHYRFMVH